MSGAGADRRAPSPRKIEVPVADKLRWTLAEFAALLGMSCSWISYRPAVWSEDGTEGVIDCGDQLFVRVHKDPTLRSPHVYASDYHEADAKRRGLPSKVRHGVWGTQFVR